MPRFPDASGRLDQIKGSVYSALAHKLATYKGESYPFHVGDTWLEPPDGCRMEDLTDIPGLSRYAQVQGHLPLLDAITDRTAARQGVATDRSSVLVTAGATGGLGAILGGILNEGDQVLIPTPFWPLIDGITRSMGGTPVHVQMFDVAHSADHAVALVEAAITERTVALYLNTPNNPTGQVMPEAWVVALVQWAQRRGLWILSDEVYEDYLYEGSHTYARSVAPERTFSVHSFSKSLGMAGNRCGYVVGPPQSMMAIRKVSTHCWYSTPKASQVAAYRALCGPGDAWIARARPLYAEAGRLAAELLGVAAPQGSTFLWLDVAEHLDETGLMGFLERCVERGLFIAPGVSFGPYPTHVRACFTATPPEVTSRGMNVLAEILER